MALQDQARGVRPGEELERQVLERLLQEQLGLGGELELLQFPSGYSNLTYLLRMGERELVLRRPPFGTKAKSAHDMGREFRVLSALHPHFPRAPKPLYHEADESVLGAPFYVMERIQGIIVRRDLAADFPIPPEQRPELCRQHQQVQAELHQLDYAAAGLGDLGRPEGYVQRQVEGWTKRLGGAPTPDVPEAADIIAWLREHLPQETRSALIHNDFKLDNVVLDPQQPLNIIGVLDWEMTTLGDPLLDLGCSLGYWVEASDAEDLQQYRMLPSVEPGFLSRQEMAEQYLQANPLPDQDLMFAYVFGVFRLAVVMQQIYYRFHLGQTSDPRFADLNGMVVALITQARRVIQTGRW